MKAFLLGVCLMVSPAFASHFITGQIEAKVVGMQNLQRLHGTVIFSWDSSIADHDQTVTLEVVKMTSNAGPGHQPGFKPGDTITLSVQKAQLNALSEGDLLTLDYKNVGDARASRISWEIVK